MTGSSGSLPVAAAAANVSRNKLGKGFCKPSSHIDRPGCETLGNTLWHRGCRGAPWLRGVELLPRRQSCIPRDACRQAPHPGTLGQLWTGAGGGKSPWGECSSGPYCCWALGPGPTPYLSAPPPAAATQKSLFPCKSQGAGGSGRVTRCPSWVLPGAAGSPPGTGRLQHSPVSAKSGLPGRLIISLSFFSCQIL